MSTCPRTTRERADTAAAALRECDGCIGVDVLDPNAGTRREWSLEIVTAEGLTPAMALALCRADALVDDVASRGGAVRAVAVL